MRRGRRAVVAREELVHEPPLVVRRVPEEVRRQVVAERGERPGGAEGVALLEHAHRPVRREEADVGRDGRDVRVRHHVAREVREIVPDKEVAAGHAPPVRQVLRERRVLRRGGVGERTREIALDVAQAHDHVGARTRLRRRAARELVGERVDAHVRELLLHRLRDLVRETQVRTRRHAAVLLHPRRAVRARAIAVPVVLRHLDEVDGRILPQTPQRLADVRGLHLPVRETQLLCHALAVHERIPLRMVLEIRRRRQHLEERVVGAVPSREEVETVVAAHLGRDELQLGEQISRERSEIPLRPHLEERIKPVQIVRLAVLELRGVFKVDAGERDFVELRVGRRGGRPPPHAAVLLQIEVDRVDRRARRVAVQHDAVRHGLEPHAVNQPALPTRPESRGRLRRAHVETREGRAPARPRLAFECNDRLHPQALAQLAGQLLRGKPLDCRGAVAKHHDGYLDLSARRHACEEPQGRHRCPAG